MATENNEGTKPTAQERFNALVQRKAGEDADLATRDQAFADVVRMRNAVRRQMRRDQRGVQL